MKFTYEYRTKSNELRQGMITADTRDDVYSQLKAQGIRPSRVNECPGFVNKLVGKGKRWMAIVILGLVCAALVWYAGRLKGASRMANAVSAVPRHQIYGDPALMEKLERDDYSGIFSNRCDRVLAGFAQPGRQVKDPGAKVKSEWASALATEGPMPTYDGESREVREFVSIVRWMREERAAFLRDGGTVEEYLKRLFERQQREWLIYLQTKNELNGIVDEAEYERRNAQLRRLGIRTVPLPE